MYNLIDCDGTWKVKINVNISVWNLSCISIYSGVELGKNGRNWTSDGK